MTRLITNSLLWRRTSGIAIASAVCLVSVLASASAAHAASPAWKLVGASGPTHMAPYVNDRQSVVVRAGSGTFRLSYEGETTADLPFSSPPAAVEAALNGLATIAADGGSVSVTGGPGGPLFEVRPYVVEFDGGPLAGGPVSELVGLSGSPPLSGADLVFGVGPTPAAELTVLATNVGGAVSSGTTTVTVGPLPAGVTVAAIGAGRLGAVAAGARGVGWVCTPWVLGQSMVTCTSDTSVPSLATAREIAVPIHIDSTAVSGATVPVSVSGGGAASEGGDTFSVPLVISNEDAPAGIAAFWAGAFDVDGKPYTQAGGHPNGAATMFLVNTKMSPFDIPISSGDPRDVIVDIPPGFVGNPLVTQRCPNRAPGVCDVSPGNYVGQIKPMAGTFPVEITGALVQIANDEPPNGYAAQFSFPILETRVLSVASLRSETDYGVTVTAPNIIPFYRVYGNYLAFEGFPAAADGKAFLTNPTDCHGGVLPTWIRANSWQNKTFSPTISDDSPPTTGCGLVPFDPSMSVLPTSAAADSASGLQASIDLPQDGLLDPDDIATSHLKKTVVELPAGLSVNPSGATGLKGCTDAEIAIGSKAKPSCPDRSKLGTVKVTSPLVDQPLDGVMYLGTPKSTDPMSGEMLRLFLVVRNDRYGILVKLPGSTTADPKTGKLTATFDNNPRLPFDHLEVKVRGGAKGLLATPQDCGQVESVSTLSPWSGNADEERPSPFTVGGSCGLGFAPKLVAGMSTAKARANGAFSFRFSRQDGEQWIDGLTAKLPKGLLASVNGFPLCSSGQAAVGSCPAASRIGTVDATAGTGDPFVLEQKGSAYLTEGYKGCPYGLMVKVPVVAGPFDKSSPATDLGDIVVRQAVCVDRSTAEVSAVSDPLPTIWHGIPIRMRSVTVIVDRPSFMLNPSSCAPKQVGGVFDSTRGGSASASSAFNNTGCSSLAFAPKLTLGLTGRNQVRTGKHPGVRAQVTQAGVSEAGIERAVVRLPKSLALDVNNAQALCEYADGIKPDLENHCPKGSIIGRARAKTPLLNNDLAGDVYFVKNVRIDPRTGNTIRTLPMLVVALRGEIAINLRGVSSTTRDDRLVNTFAAVPDAPITRFNMNINGGRNGILAVTRTRRALINLCAKPRGHIAEADIDGHNGRRYDRDIRMRTPCTRRQIKQARKAAKKQAGQAKRAARSPR